MRDLGLTPGMGRTPGERKCYPLQYSGLENSRDYIVHGVAKSWTQLNDFHFTSFLIFKLQLLFMGFRGGSDSKEFACYAEDLGSIPGLRRSPGGGHGNTLQYSCQENPMDRGAWWTMVRRVLKSQTQLEQLSSQH